MTPEIILPEIWLIKLGASWNSTDPIVFTILVFGFDMALEATVGRKTTFADSTTAGRCFIVLRLWRCFGSGVVRGLLLNLTPRVHRIWYRGFGDSAGVEMIVI